MMSPSSAGRQLSAVPSQCVYTAGVPVAVDLRICQLTFHYRYVSWNINDTWHCQWLFATPAWIHSIIRPQAASNDDSVITVARAAAITMAREAGTAARSSCSLCYLQFLRHPGSCIMSTVLMCMCDSCTGQDRWHCGSRWMRTINRLHDDPADALRPDQHSSLNNSFSSHNICNYFNQ